MTNNIQFFHDNTKGILPISRTIVFQGNGSYEDGTKYKFGPLTYDISRR
jgi:hypothetical protein